MTFLAWEAQGPIFWPGRPRLEKPCFRSRFYGPFLVPSPGISKSRSPGRSGKVPGRFPGRAIINPMGRAQKLKMEVIYIYIYTHVFVYLYIYIYIYTLVAK